MKSIEENEFLNSLRKEFNIELPNNLQTRKIYQQSHLQIPANNQ